MAGGITQAEYWNGEVGARWARNQAVLDAVFAPLTEALFDRAALRGGESVLDIGCGSGATSLEAARRVGPEGAVTGADISAPLLAVARSRAEAETGAAPIRFVEADVERADLGAYGQALSRFGVMFFPDSARAFANIRRMLHPGGRLTFLCWRALPENLWVTVPREAVLPLLPRSRRRRSRTRPARSASPRPIRWSPCCAAPASGPWPAMRSTATWCSAGAPPMPRRRRPRRMWRSISGRPRISSARPSPICAAGPRPPSPRP